MVNRKLFVNVPAPKNGSAKNPSFEAHIKGNVTKAVQSGVKQIVNQRMGNVPPAAKEFITTYATDVAAGAINNMINNAGNRINNQVKGQNNIIPKPGGAVAFSGKGTISETNVNYALSKAPNPKAISLNSGIKPNTWSNDYMTPVEGACSPLHMTAIKMAIPTSATNPISSYFTNTICFDIQTRAQANIGFGLDVGTKLTSAQIVTAYNAAIYALQIYFYYSSILAYESDSRNKNAGMIALRAMIDSSVMSDLVQLGRRLEDTPIPPRVVEWVRYMNGNFLSSMSQGSPLLKFCPVQPVVGSNPSPTLPSLALAGLNNDANNTVFSLLRKAIPQWRVKRLFDCPVIPTFDKQFLSIFANVPTVNMPVSGAIPSHSVANTSTAFPYNTYSNILDGLAFAMSSAYTGAELIPGIITNGSVVNTTMRDTRVSYYSVSSVLGFYPVVNIPFLVASRQETYSFSGTTLTTPHLYGTDRAQNVSGINIIQSAQNTLDFLFNINSIPLNGTVSNFNKVTKQLGRI